MTRNDKLGKVIENIDFLSINNLFGKPSTKCLTSCTVWKDVGRSVTHLPDDEVYLIVTLILQILEYVTCEAASTDYFVRASVRLHICSPLIAHCFSEYLLKNHKIEFEILKLYMTAWFFQTFTENHYDPVTGDPQGTCTIRIIQRISDAVSYRRRR